MVTPSAPCGVASFVVIGVPQKCCVGNTDCWCSCDRVFSMTLDVLTARTTIIRYPGHSE